MKEIWVARAPWFESPQEAEDFWVTKQLREQADVEPVYSIKSQMEGRPTVTPIDARKLGGLVTWIEEPGEEISAFIFVVHALRHPVLAFVPRHLDSVDILGGQLQHETPPGGQHLGVRPNAEYLRIDETHPHAISLYRGTEVKLKLANWLRGNVLAVPDDLPPELTSKD